MAHSQRYLRLLEFLEQSNANVYLPLEAAWKVLEDQYRNDYMNVQHNVWVCAATGYYLLQKEKYDPCFIANMKDLHIRKNAGYSGLHDDPWYNFRQVERFGISTQDGIIARLTDKYQRYINLRDNPALDQVQESLMDTLQDFVAYCLILYCVMEEDAFTAKEKEKES